MQHLSCPFCSLDFSVYAKMEELDQDAAYFFHRAGLMEVTTFLNYDSAFYSSNLELLLPQVDTDAQLNKAMSRTSLREGEFWSGVQQEVVSALEEAYRFTLPCTWYSYYYLQDGPGDV